MVDLLRPESPSDELLTRWLQKHVDLLAAERKEEQDQSRLLLSKCSPKQLERNGLALLGLGALNVSIGLGGKILAELERPVAYHSSPNLPPHTLRPGDIVQLEDHATDPTKPAKGSKSSSGNEAYRPVSGVVFKVSDSKLVVALGASGKKIANGGKEGGGGSSNEAPELPHRIRVVKVANEATFDRMEATLARLGRQLGLSIKTSRSKPGDDSSSESDAESSQRGSKNESTAPSSSLIRALVAQVQPTWTKEATSLPLPLFNANLNESQQRAIQFALRADRFALIHGPPGTGKTTAVAELVLQLALGQEKRVLVCGASNLAADNVMERIIEKGGEALRSKGLGITRIGHPARVLQSLVTSTLDYQSQNSSEGGLLKDVREELQSSMKVLRPDRDAPAAGNKSTSSRGQASSRAGGKGRMSGSERRQRWEEVRVLRKEYRKRERGLTKAVISRASIVVATCHGAGGRQLNNIDFDTVIIDEACQATEAACWIPIMRAKADGKVILAGDHLQLPPTVKGFRHSQVHRKQTKTKTTSKKKEADVSEETAKTLSSMNLGDDEGPQADEENDEGEGGSFETSKQVKDPKKRRAVLRPPRSLETTLFSRLLGLFGPGCKALLDVQYRMNEEIMAFPNDALYESQLKAHQSNQAIRLSDLNNYEVDAPATEEEEKDDARLAPLVFIDTAGSDMFETSASGSDDVDTIVGRESKTNQHEVELVHAHVEMLIQAGLRPAQIGVLSPYSAQVSLLAERLSTFRDANTGERIEVGTIDGMQGRENEAIILSLVRSNEEANVGFLAEKRRLNVAMTRAKRQLCVIGDSTTCRDSGDEYLGRWMDHLEENALVDLALLRNQ